jgi:hypothetical protein
LLASAQDNSPRQMENSHQKLRRRVSSMPSETFPIQYSGKLFQSNRILCQGNGFQANITRALNWTWNDGYSKDVPVRKRQQTPYRLPVSHVQITRRMMNHNTHANCATFLNIESTQHTTHVSAPKPTNENQNRELFVTHDSKTPTLRINDIYSIEVGICLKRHSETRMRSELGRSGSASFKTCRAEVRGASRELGTWARPRWQHTSG